MAERLSDLEAAVLQMLLSRDEPGYDVLKTQLSGCLVRGRTVSSAGFFTDLDVDRSAARADHEVVGNPLGSGKDFDEDVLADIEGLKWGAMFLLWLEDGRLSQLEGFTFAGDDPWPQGSPSFKLRWEPVNRASS